MQDHQAAQRLPAVLCWQAIGLKHSAAAGCKLQAALALLQMLEHQGQGSLPLVVVLGLPVPAAAEGQQAVQESFEPAAAAAGHQEWLQRQLLLLLLLLLLDPAAQPACLPLDADCCCCCKGHHQHQHLQQQLCRRRGQLAHRSLPLLSEQAGGCCPSLPDGRGWQCAYGRH
jgi:hypothetical protein